MALPEVTLHPYLVVYCIAPNFRDAKSLEDFKFFYIDFAETIFADPVNVTPIMRTKMSLR